MGYFIGKSHFDEYGTQHCLVFRPILRYFTLNSNCIIEWKSKGLSNESLEVVSATGNTLTPSINYYEKKVRLRFTESVLQQKAVIYSHKKKIVNLYLVYEITNFPNVSSYSTLKNALFGADIDKYSYFGYGIGFDGHGSFSYPSIGTGNNVIIFGADVSSSVDIDNKKKDILILGKGLTQQLDEHSLTVEKVYSINLTEVHKKFCLNLYYNGANSQLFVKSTEIHKFKAKDSEIVPNNLWLGYVSKDFLANNWI